MGGLLTDPMEPACETKISFRIYIHSFSKSVKKTIDDIFTQFDEFMHILCMFLTIEQTDPLGNN